MSRSLFGFYWPLSVGCSGWRAGHLACTCLPVLTHGAAREQDCRSLGYGSTAHYCRWFGPHWAAFAYWADGAADPLMGQDCRQAVSVAVVLGGLDPVRWVGARGRRTGSAERLLSLNNNVIFLVQIPYQFQSIPGRWDRLMKACGWHIRLEETRMSQLSSLPHSAIRTVFVFVRQPVERGDPRRYR